MDDNSIELAFEIKLIFCLFAPEEFEMEDSKILQQIQAILRLFMAFFYIGAGIFMLFFWDFFQINRALLEIVGGAFLFYGAYRLYMAGATIYKLFFSKGDDQD